MTGSLLYFGVSLCLQIAHYFPSPEHLAYYIRYLFLGEPSSCHLQAPHLYLFLFEALYPYHRYLLLVICRYALALNGYLEHIRKT